MSEREAFLASIRAAPEDDAPRLVYADWLDERGEPLLAEFIRLQIALARTTCSPRCNLHAAGVRSSPCICPRGPLRDRESEVASELDLEKLSAEAITVPCGYHVGGRSAFLKSSGLINLDLGVGGRTIVGWEWRRGFIDEITCTSEDFEQYAHIFFRQPITSVKLLDKESINVKRKRRGSRCYAWFAESAWRLEREANRLRVGRDQECVLPDIMMPVQHKRRCSYLSRELADKALSDRLVAVGRAKQADAAALAQVMELV